MGMMDQKSSSIELGTVRTHLKRAFPGGHVKDCRNFKKVDSLN
jgi:hypothetical protein